MIVGPGATSVGGLLFTVRSAEAACPHAVLPSAVLCVYVVSRIVDGVITTGPFIQHPLTSSVSTEPLRGAMSAQNQGTRQLRAGVPVCTQCPKKETLCSFFF